MTEQVPVSKLRDWVRKSISSELAHVERESDKLLTETSRVLTSLPEYCAQLGRKSEQDMESKRDNRAQYRAAKAVGRLTSIISGICTGVNVPVVKDTVSLRALQRDTSKFATEAARVREEWLHQIRPYYILDMMTLGGNIDKVRRLSDELHTFLIGRGALLHSLEDLDTRIESLTRVQGTRDSITEQKNAAEGKLKEAQTELDSLKQEAVRIRQNPKIKDYMQTDAQLRDLRNELLRTGFSRLGRPLKKLMSISERGEYPTPIEVRERAKEYTRKPFATFLKEQDGLPGLKAVMSALSKAVSSGKLALKQREAKKVVERAEQVVSGGLLAKIHAQAKELKRVHDDQLAEAETSSLVQRYRELLKKGRATRNLKEELQAELQRVRDSERKLDEQINTSAKEIEAYARKLADSNVKVLVS
jgi:hypothetical protein